MKTRKAFTLVELLVVIGIIALLISILLPALSGARRQANTLKCSAALREIYKCTLMYVEENRGYMPPARCGNDPGGNYNLYGIIYRGTNSGTDVVGVSVTQWAYWYNFLSKYATKNTMAGQTASQKGDSLNTILWGCPQFTGYTVGAQSENMVGGFNRIYTGVGINGQPWVSPSAPANDVTTGEIRRGANGDPKASDIGSNNDWISINAGVWYKYTQYRNPSQRALLADCMDWALYIKGSAPGGVIPGQSIPDGPPAPGGYKVGQTTFDFYRHGSNPRSANANEFAADGGKVKFNILYCDGHVVTSNDRADAYRSYRMRFPG